MKKILRVSISLIILSIGLLVGCKSNDSNKNLYNEIDEIKDVKSIDVEELSKYENTDIKDSQTIKEILSKLPANIYFRKLNYENNYGEYTLNLKYNMSKDWTQEETAKFMNANSIVLFSLINNVKTINYTLGDFEDTVYTFDIEEYEDDNIKLMELPSNIDMWRKVINKI